MRHRVQSFFLMLPYERSERGRASRKGIFKMLMESTSKTSANANGSKLKTLEREREKERKLRIIRASRLAGST